ncbi:MAG: helix-turn-helix transcriptional regulator [Clostridia bacterium]|nr:helix-turn-helix transcriptional regulator [Clostridia bacterium]
MSYESQIFCENLKQLRKRESLTKVVMAKKLGIGVQTLTKIENGIIPPLLSTEILYQIHHHFGIMPTEMFTPSFIR